MFINLVEEENTEKEFSNTIRIDRKKSTIWNTWTHRAIMSAKRERDFAGYIPFNDVSTILDNASISWSWGVAHLTRDCSDLTLELKDASKWKVYISYPILTDQISIWAIRKLDSYFLNSTKSNKHVKNRMKLWGKQDRPVQWLPTSQ